MKHILIILLLLSNLLSIAQNKERIKDIEEKCRYIDGIEHYQIIGFKGHEFLDDAFITQTDAYGQLYAYFRNDSLYKIREIYGLQQQEVICITEYYYYEDKLIFVRETENNGPDVVEDMNDIVNYRMKIPEFEGLYYFFYGMLINKLIEGEQILLPNEKLFDSQDKEGQLLSASEKNRELIFKNYLNH